MGRKVSARRLGAALDPADKTDGKMFISIAFTDWHCMTLSATNISRKPSTSVAVLDGFSVFLASDQQRSTLFIAHPKRWRSRNEPIVCPKPNSIVVRRASSV